jgi:hypothetical protein
MADFGSDGALRSPSAVRGEGRRLGKAPEGVPMRTDGWFGGVIQGRRQVVSPREAGGHAGKDRKESRERVANLGGAAYVTLGPDFSAPPVQHSPRVVRQRG